MSYLLNELKTKQEIDGAIMKTLDKVLVLRFGKANDLVCLQLDQIVSIRNYPRYVVHA